MSAFWARAEQTLEGPPAAPAGDPEEPPLRAELLTVSQLEQHARTLAGWHQVGPPGGAREDRLLPRLAANEQAFRDAHALITDAVARGTRITPAAEWFIDNYHLIEEQIRTARRHLPRGYNRELPRLANAPNKGTPLVYDIALELVSHSDGRLDLHGLRAFVASYQSVRPLRIGELWAIPIMLRIALLENLRRVVGRIVAGRRDRERAAEWVERMFSAVADDPAKVVLTLADLVRANPTLTNAFVAEFASRLQGRGPGLLFPITWLEQRLAEQGRTVEQVFQVVSQSQAADQVSIGNSIGSLRLLGATDWRDFVEAMSVVELTFRQDPAGVYATMDFATRDRYRHVVEAVAKRSTMSEDAVAQAALELARKAASPRSTHIGFFLVDEGRAELDRVARVPRTTARLLAALGRRARLALYAGAIASITAAATALFLAWWPNGPLDLRARAGLGVLFAICASQLAVALVNWAATLLVPPRLLARLDFSAGIPADCRTVVAVPTMLTDHDETDGLLESLEVRYLANRDDHLFFALLTDFRDAPTETLPTDDALLARATVGIQALNAKYATTGAARFFLYHRARRLNPREGAWMGWERKRGKLEEFNLALRGDPRGFVKIVGEPERLIGARYVIALDSDTQLPRDAARQLAGTMAHPLNRPGYDQRRGRVTQGYSILQPRVAITMASANRSRYARLFGGEPGIDPYTRAVSDVYQDVFGEGSFVGKGIYDVDAFQGVLGGSLPENRILSHDLLESAYARSGMVSDVSLFEDYPSAYLADMSRRYRWIRGDWQIAGWLGFGVPGGDGRRRRNPISLLSRWKLLDNLRRSLVPIALTALLLVGLATHVTGFAVLAVLTIVFVPGLLASAAQLVRRPADLAPSHHVREIGRALGTQLLREMFALICLPHDAVLSATAILSSTWRMLITRRKLLEWRTAADAQRAARTHLGWTFVSMWATPLVAAVGGALIMDDLDALALAAPVLVLWALAPALALVVSLPILPTRPRLAPDELTFLHALARRTWRFFETFVTAEDHHLPPDNFQADPPQGIAHRTSPTNIGLSLVANLGAYDLGYLTPTGLLERTTLALATMDKLARYGGHFYNWYDTRTLEPLRPMYVSTVDSGNLAGHLLTLAAGLDELGGHEIFRIETFAGLRDTLDVLVDVAPAATAVLAEVARVRLELQAVPSSLSGARTLLERVIASVRPLARAAEAHPGDELAHWIRALEAQARHALDELAFTAPWVQPAGVPDLGDEAATVLAGLDAPLTLAEVARLERVRVPALGPLIAAATPARAARLVLVRDALVVAAERAAARLATLRTLARRCEELSDLDYDVLYDRERNLLSIGYDVGEFRLDASFYDLLASEARLASFVAIAQGKLPQDHWFSLGRLLTTSGRKPVLLSWSGSMFEYLMPLLVMPTYEGTLLDETYRGVVERQIEYGQERGVPWGVSESGYNKTDAHLNYQYRAFGVPGLGFKRSLADDLVVAPYASAMALMVDPKRACDNLRRLARDGVLGPHGFYEAVDYTISRLPRGKTSFTIRSYMAHHQGMVFLALDYLLADRPMQRRFDALPAFRATDLLLQERVARTPPIYPHPAEVSAAGQPLADHEKHVLRVYPATTPAPEVHLLSNGTYHVAVTNAGGGYSRWRDLAVTRWHEDPTRDCWGSFAYLRDVESGLTWSTAHQPTLVKAASYEAIFTQGRAEFRRSDQEIVTHVEISVSPEDDVELRRVTLTNVGRTARTIELTTYAEVVLATPAADAAHPAFSNLFVQTELVRPRHAILCTRRPRSGTERPPWMLHIATVTGGTQEGTTSFETSRSTFIGRGGSAQDPAALHRDALDDGEGSVLDPIVAIRVRVTIEPHQSARLQLVTGMSETRDGALGLIEKYSDRHAAERVFELSWTHSQVVLRRLEASEDDTQLYGRLASKVLYASPSLRAPRGILARNRGGQSSLWAYGISGDLPIVLVRIADREHVRLVHDLVKAHAYWRLKGLAVDLVIWNEDPSGYRQELQDEILMVIASLSEASLLDRAGGIFVRRSDQLSEEDKILMQTVARVIVSDTDGSLAEQLDRRPPAELPGPLFVGGARPTDATPMPRPGKVVRGERPDLVAWNGLGGFTPDGREYVITTSRGNRTPAPWCNVLANPWFGTVVSESGGAYTWCENAHAYRLTPWHNDAVTDASGEALYLRDEEDGSFWSPTPLPAGGPGPYTTRHGFGYSIFEHDEGGVATRLTTYVAIDAPLKFLVLRVQNKSGRARQLSVTGLFELALGASRAANVPYVVTEIDAESGGLFARNAYSTEFARRVAFLDSSVEHRTVSGDRAEFIGRNGTHARPRAMTRARLSNRVGAGLDPCFAMQVGLDLAEGEERTITFTFGSGMDLPDARTLLHRFRGTGKAGVALEGVWAYWNRTLGAVNVQTPDPSLNFLANGWLLYQVLASRMWGRSGFYQSGGAFGFRDQLQDSMALVHAEPALLREQLLRAAGRQFREGDVQHWWHPPAGRGVRTQISDDYLWLPYAACRYVVAVGDTGVLGEAIPFLEGRQVKPEEDSYYDLPLRSEESAPLYVHCKRAIEHGLRYGVHGLPLMGTGDWNDGMNLVGHHGQGESVWLAFFLHDVLVRFVALARLQGDTVFATRCTTEAARLAANIEQHGWDGAWYRRAYFDDGTPLGSSTSPGCQIDSLPQSWAVLAGVGTKERAAQGLAAVDARLVRRDLGVIQLFDPPFDVTELEPGYVKGYVPGVRENGGQYTHAAVWAVMAFAEAGEVERAWELFDMVNPVRHGDTAARIATYKVEPYVLAADVYTNPQHAGRGGWTWYTGSASWMYRLIVESLLGLELVVDRLKIAPRIPSEWPGFEVHYRYREAVYHIRVKRLGRDGSVVTRVTCDGVEQAEHLIVLVGEPGEHQVDVELGGA